MLAAEYERLKDTAERWGYSAETIRLWCKSDTIPGAIQPGGENGEWRIPAGITLADRAAHLAGPAKPARRNIRRTRR